MVKRLQFSLLLLSILLMLGAEPIQRPGEGIISSSKKSRSHGNDIRMTGVECQENLIPQNYQKHMRPSPAGGGPVEIGVSWHISRIHQVSADEMFLEISLRPTIIWHDDRIQYDGTHHTKESKLLPLSMDYLQETWKPDLFFLDTREVVRYYMIDEVAGLWLMENKTFYLSFLTKIKLDCPMRYHKYPFDTQTCWLTILSYEYNNEEVSLFWMDHGVTYSPVLHEQLPGYYVYFSPGEAAKHKWCEDCFLEPASALRASITLERRYGAYLLTVYVPSGLFVAVAWVSFFWPPDSVPGRTVLVITSLLTVVSMYASVRQSSPHTDYAKATDVWFFVCICFNVLVLFEFACVIWLRRQHSKVSKSMVVPITPSQNSVKGPSNSPAGQPHRSEATLRMSKLEKTEEMVEFASKIFYPILFIFFNLVYWLAYMT